ncbi:MAG: glutamate 5-kinase [Hyphococcus sp.]|nr:MAG: glutamate 5-kinase [Marinicaulis sp.]
MSQSSHFSAAQLSGAKRIVVKIGSALLCDEDGAVRSKWLATLAADIVGLRSGGCEVIVVSSGAVALGRQMLKLSGDLRLDEKQAASATGQAALIQAWQKAFEVHNVQVAQLLLTLDDTEYRNRYLNARATMRTLLDVGALPLVNENDTVATAEIRYGDNDRLAAHTAQVAGAELLIILSDVDGVYSADPRLNADARHLDVIGAITPDIENCAGGPNRQGGIGSGGMASKIAAAKIASANGCATIIASGLIEHPLVAISHGELATLITPNGNAENARRQWIGGRLKPSGKIIVDQGAAEALLQGASLLPAGVIGVGGNFSRGDVVEIVDQKGIALGKGLVTFDASDVERIAGHRSEAIEKILGYRRRPAIIEKDDLVLREGTVS